MTRSREQPARMVALPRPASCGRTRPGDEKVAHFVFCSSSRAREESIDCYLYFYFIVCYPDGFLEPASGIRRWIGRVIASESTIDHTRNGQQDQAGRDACPDGQAVVGRGGYRDRDGFLDHHDAHVCVEGAKRIGCRHVEAAPEGASVQPGRGVRRGHVWIHDRGRRGRPDESHDSQHVQLDSSACVDGDVPRGRDLDRVGVWLCVHVARQRRRGQCFVDRSIGDADRTDRGAVDEPTRLPAAAEDSGIFFARRRAARAAQGRARDVSRRRRWRGSGRRREIFRTQRRRDRRHHRLFPRGTVQRVSARRGADAGDRGHGRPILGAARYRRRDDRDAALGPHDAARPVRDRSPSPSLSLSASLALPRSPSLYLTVATLAHAAPSSWARA